MYALCRPRYGKRSRNNLASAMMRFVSILLLFFSFSSESNLVQAQSDKVKLVKKSNVESSYLPASALSLCRDCSGS
jgi:hypothetical protein